MESIPQLVAQIFGVQAFFYTLVRQWFPVIQEKVKESELIQNLYHIKVGDIDEDDPHKVRAVNPDLSQKDIGGYKTYYERFKFTLIEGFKFISIKASPIPFTVCSYKSKRDRKL